MCIYLHFKFHIFCVPVYSGPDKESVDAQNTGTGRSGKHIKGGSRLLKCSGDKNIEGSIITLDQKTR